MKTGVSAIKFKIISFILFNYLKITNTLNIQSVRSQENKINEKRNQMRQQHVEDLKENGTNTKTVLSTAIDFRLMSALAITLSM